MGLWKLLTTPLLAQGETIRWQQPLLVGMRLRNEVLRRMGVLAACVVTGAAALAIAIVLSGGERVPAVALAIGALFGLVVALYLAFRKDDWGGHVIVGREGIELRRTYPAFPVLLGIEHLSWPYAAIRRCVIVPASATGKRFSLLIVYSGKDAQLLAIATWVDLQDLGRRIKGRGVDVSLGKAIPDQFVSGSIPTPVVATVLGIAAVAGLALLLVVPRWGGKADMSRRDPGDLRDEFAGAGVPRKAHDPEFGSIPVADSFGSDAMLSTDANPETTLAGRPGPIVGGAGGFPYQSVSEIGQPLLGVIWFPGEWDGTKALARLESVFDRTAPLPDDSALAPEGYAVGAVEVDAGEFVHAVRLLFWRLRPDGSLDPADSRTSNWLGVPTGQEPRRLSGDGAPVIGLHGRAGAVLDAVGLVFAAGS